MEWFFAFAQTVIFIIAAPLFASWIKRIKCRLQNRKPPTIWQPYLNLWRLFGKQIVLSHTASPVFRFTPYIVIAATVLAAAVIPLISINLPLYAVADVIVLIGFFALARFFLTLAGLDVGTAFGGMGSSREMMISSLAEPAMLLAVFTLAMVASSTNLSTMILQLIESNVSLRPSLLFAFLSLLLVAVAETGRIPVDNPSTHLELTMVHEAMILEYTGRHLALIEWAGMIKQMIYGVLIANIFFPWGIATELTMPAVIIAILAITGKLLILGITLAVSETVLAKMRVFRVPGFLILAVTLALVGLLSHIILENY
ncbi:Hydrogenase-4 component C [hydrothermal vent metagenome]|uniref:Hydrogenase-4 component C n=1 Tax=hydrothermal vent metagenome TaxID=652676 RepID=A0A3B1AC84_9ZZZZ